MHRPRGQVKLADKEAPDFSETKKLDFELEMGAFIGGDLNKLGYPIKCCDAEDYIFGYVLLNDWSARDIQAWEYVPLGPFNAKNFCTVISPWIVTLQALEEFRVPLETQNPPPLKYLYDSNLSSFNIDLEVGLKTSKNSKIQNVGTSNFKHLYWSVTQQLTHHAVTGCNMNAGDLLGTGTISGTEPEQTGSMMERTWNGKNPVILEDDEKRTFIEDGDEVILTGASKSKDGYSIGFGDCATKVLSALSLDHYYNA